MKASILATGLNLRKTPEVIDGNIITILKKSNILDILESNKNGWTKVQYGIYSGYVASQYLKIIAEVPKTEMSIPQRALGIAIGQLGNEEIPRGSNWGKHVEKYLKSVNINYPASWCMAFVYWCFNEACKELKIENKLPKTAGVLNFWNLCPKEWRVTSPEKGDIGIMDFGKGKGHTFIVASLKDSKTVNTVEGNSNDEGSREGFEVCRKPNGRKINSCKGFIRIPNDFKQI